MDSLQKKYRINKIMIYGALTLGAVLMIFPLYLDVSYQF